MYHFVYITVNAVNLNFYIGKHSAAVIDDHYLGSGYILKRAIKKYGRNNFYRLNLGFFDSEEEAFLMEKQIIANLPCREGCYNIGSGGEGGDNISNNPNKKDILKKMSLASIKNWKNQEYRDHINTQRSISMTTDEHRKLRSLLAKDLWEDQEYREKTIRNTVAALNTKESKLKRSKIHTEIWQNEEYRNKMLGLFRSEEHKKKLSEATKKLFREHPEILEEINRRRNAANRRPEARLLMSEKMKKRWQTNQAVREALTIGRMGNKNPCWGSKWMFNTKNGDIKKAQPHEISSLLEQGWQFGRPSRKGHKFSSL